LNRPIKIFKYELTAKKKRPVMVGNPIFISEVKKKFKNPDPIPVMCRYGANLGAGTDISQRL